MTGWVYLLLAGLCEVGFTTVLRQLNGGTGSRWLLQSAFVVLIIASFQFLQMASKTVPLGTAYAVWTGIGAAGTVVIGMRYFGERADPARLLLLAVLVASVVGLKLVEHATPRAQMP